MTPGEAGRYGVGGNDKADYFSLLVKQWTRYRCETKTDSVDTELFIQDEAGHTLYYNDDRATGEIESWIEWTADTEQTVYIVVKARGDTYGAYALQCIAYAPPTATPYPTAVVVVTVPPQPIPIPAPVVVVQRALQPTATATRSLTVTATAITTMTATATPDTRIMLVVRKLPNVVTTASAAQTEVSLLIYYDANNDRKPSPDEGVPNVSVMLVNGNGQPIQQAFTSALGEVRLTAPQNTQRIVVPFVSGWSETIRHGAVGGVTHNNFQIGLQAVEIPVFIPVETQADNGGQE